MSSTSLLALGRSYEELPREALAGFLVMTSVPDQPVRAERMRDLLQANGLDATVVPQKRPEVFDFQAACRAVETRRGQTASRGRQLVTVGEVVTNAAESVYQITAEERDEANRVIEHRKGMRVVYDKGRAGDPVVGDDPIRFEPIESETLYRSLSDLADHINAHFRVHRGMVPGPKVREILRNAFRGMHGTRWTNSVWFIGVAQERDLKAWRTVVTELYADATFDIVPLPNTRELREQLEGKIGEHVKEDATKLMAEIAKLLSEGKPVKQAQFERMNALRREIGGHADEMQALYGDEIATVTEAMGLVDTQLMEMWGRIA